ncbi:hypothetical protein [uncultured Desulfovibrio sp.]|jgi:hypothetical protein|uniref:hypothetical protein n=1 Tax=uncultured Desulfovibrio sp. TaxID=167968 RepID=UPI00261A1E70|nr:hypothetical protein [uncultured Desulfovibrio sp.]
MVTANLPNEFRGKYEGDVSISNDMFKLFGMIVGNVFVTGRGYFICNGMVTGNVYVDSESSADIYGMVNGQVSGDGEIKIFGMVNGNG